MKGAWISIVVAVLGISTAAQAQVVYTQTPISGELKLSLGSYKPDVGAAFTRVFGNAGILLAQLQYDRYVWRKFGTVGFGISVGYGEKYGHALSASDGTSTSVTTALLVAPLSLTALYNFDYAAEHWRIPLVPYVRGGLAFVPWWSLKNGRVEYVDGDRGAGGKWGWTVTGGLAFQLDVLEPRLAHDLDSDIGINHSYLYGEYVVLSATGGKGPNLSDNYFNFGITFEF